MRVRWTPAAAADLELIKDYLKKQYPHFAQPTVLGLDQAFAREDGSRNRHTFLCESKIG